MNRYRQIQGLIYQGKLEQAQKELDQWIESSPQNSKAQLLEAELLLKKGALEKVERLLSRLQKSLGTHADFLRLKGKVLLAKRTKKAAQEAMEIFEYLFNKFPKKSAYLYYLTEACLLAGRPQKAWSWLQSAPYELQDNPYLRRLKAKVLVALKRYEDALKIYEMLLKENPQDVGLKRQILTLKKHLKGEKNWEKEVELIAKLPSSQKDPSIILTYAQLAKQRGETDKATALYRQVLKIDPKNRAAALNLGFLLVKSPDPNQIQEGLQILKQFFLENPYDHPVRSALFATYKNLGKIEELLNLLQEAILRHPEKVRIYGWIKRFQKLLETNSVD